MQEFIKACFTLLEQFLAPQESLYEQLTATFYNPDLLLAICLGAGILAYVVGVVECCGEDEAIQRLLAATWELPWRASCIPWWRPSGSARFCSPTLRYSTS